MKNLFLKIKVLVVLAPTLCLSFTSQASTELNKKQVKQYLSNLSKGERAGLLEKAEIFNPKYNPDKVKNIDLIADLEKSCGYEYQRGSNEIVWPRTECLFYPDKENSLSGGSSKFLCDFPGNPAVKVKYAPNKNVFTGESEVVETIIGSSMARLIGFPTNRYCPTEVTCFNCPNSDPWNHKNWRKPEHSSVAATESRKEFFPNALIEDKLSVYHLSVSSTNGKAPNGVNWPELAQISKNLPVAERKRMAIEREVMILWIHFLMNPDAGNFNNRVSCPKKDIQQVAGPNGSVQYTCARPDLFVHDYGHAFYEHFQFQNYVKNPILITDQKRGGCYGILGRNNIQQIRKATPLVKDDSTFILDARISSEARDELVNRLRRITDDQLRTIYQLARIERAMKDSGLQNVSVDEFVGAIKKQIKTMEDAKCLPFDEGSSILGSVLRN